MGEGVALDRVSKTDDPMNHKIEDAMSDEAMRWRADAMKRCPKSKSKSQASRRASQGRV